MRFWIEWEAIYENYFYTEEVDEEGLENRLNDKTIFVKNVEILPFDIEEEEEEEM